jgi:periplasmic protein TonB
MKRVRGGMGRLAPPLAGSLLLHLVLFGALLALAPSEHMVTDRKIPLIVDYPVPPESESFQHAEHALQQETAAPHRQRRMSKAVETSGTAPILHKPVPSPAERHPTATVATPPFPSKDPKGEAARQPVHRDISIPVPAALVTIDALSQGTAAKGQTAKGSGGGGAAAEGLTGGGSDRGRGRGAASKWSAGGGSVRRTGYEALVIRLIEDHKKYPFAARKTGREGSCGRSFILDRNGSLKSVAVLTSCGSGLLDGAATCAITSVGTFPPLPKEIPGKEAKFNVIIRFTLSEE